MYLDYNRTKLLAEELEAVNSIDLVKLYIFLISPRMAAKQYVQDNEWYDYLEIEDLGTAYMDKYDCEIFYALDEGSDIFE